MPPTVLKLCQRYISDIRYPADGGTSNNGRIAPYFSINLNTNVTAINLLFFQYNTRHICFVSMDLFM